MKQRRGTKGYRAGSVPPGFAVLPPVSKFFQSLGKVYIRDTAGRDGSDAPPVFGLHVRPKHGNRHGTGHGGFLATLADTFMAAFIRHQRPEVDKMWTTQLALDYRRPVPIGAWLECHLAELKSEGDILAVTCELRVGSLITSRATATFKVAGRK